jgi:hypothetical protein
LKVQAHCPNVVDYPILQRGGENLGPSLRESVEPGQQAITALLDSVERETALLVGHDRQRNERVQIVIIVSSPLVCSLDAHRGTRERFQRRTVEDHAAYRSVAQVESQSQNVPVRNRTNLEHSAESAGRFHGSGDDITGRPRHLAAELAFLVRDERYAVANPAAERHLCLNAVTANTHLTADLHEVQINGHGFVARQSPELRMKYVAVRIPQLQKVRARRQTEGRDAAGVRLGNQGRRGLIESLQGNSPRSGAGRLRRDEDPNLGKLAQDDFRKPRFGVRRQAEALDPSRRPTLALNDQGVVFTVKPHDLRKTVLVRDGPRRHRSAPVLRRRRVRLGPHLGAGDGQARVLFQRMERHGGSAEKPQRFELPHASRDVPVEEIARRPALHRYPIVGTASRSAPTEEVPVQSASFHEVERSRLRFEPALDRWMSSTSEALTGR